MFIFSHNRSQPVQGAGSVFKMSALELFSVGCFSLYFLPTSLRTWSRVAPAAPGIRPCSRKEESRRKSLNFIVPALGKSVSPKAPTTLRVAPPPPKQNAQETRISHHPIYVWGSDHEEIVLSSNGACHARSVGWETNKDFVGIHDFLPAAPRKVLLCPWRKALAKDSWGEGCLRSEPCMTTVTKCE